MGKQSKQPKGVHLSDAEKSFLKANILKEFPSLTTFDSEIDFMINEYCKDKNYLKRLMEKKDVVAEVQQNVKEEDQTEVKVYKPDSEEYKRVMAALEVAKKEHEDKIKEGYEAEQRAKLSSNSNIEV